MGQGWSSLLIIALAFGAPAISWLFGKLKEQHELKKARDAARERQQESLRATHIVDRTERPAPEQQRERQVSDLAARRQAQLRELRERQARSTSTPPVVTRAPSAPTRPTPTRSNPPAPPARQPQPLRPGVPASRRPGPRPPRTTPPQARPAPPRPVQTARPVPVPSSRRRSSPPPPPAKPRLGTPAPLPSPIAGDGSSPSRRLNISKGVHRTLGGATRTKRSRESIAQAMALVEVLSPPISLRDPSGLPWNS